MSKKNIYLIISLAVAVLLLIIGFLFLFNSINNKNIAALNNKLNNGEATVPAADKSIIKTPETTVPAAISTSTLISMTGGRKTALDLAKASGDVGECLKIKDTGYQSSCIILLAENLQNKDLCSNIKDSKIAQACSDQVLLRTAAANNKISLCLQIQDGNLNQACILEVSQQLKVKASDCDTLPEKEKGYCLDYVYISSAKSATDCQNVPDEQRKKDCLGVYAN